MAGFRIEWFDSIDSTNAALEKADRDARKGNLEQGTVFAALSQTAGRGQKGNSWNSAPGENLTFSVLIKPEGLPASAQSTICHAASLAVCGYLASKGIETAIKWPNDIYAGDRKICGILIENTLAGAYIGKSIVGIGLNVNQTAFEPSLPNPVSMKMLTGISYSLEEELPELLEHFFSIYGRTSSFRERNYLEARYTDRLYRRGEWHEFELMQESDVPTEHRSGKPVTARILGVDASFRLILEFKNGKTDSFPFKSVKYSI